MPAPSHEAPPNAPGPDPSPPAAAAPPPRKLSRRASLIGSAIAIAVTAGLAWLAWDLTRPSVPGTGATAGAQRGPGGPGGGGGRGPGGRGGATTVGFAVAERADIPVAIEALGTVVPQATVRVRPQVSGPLQQVLFREGQNVKRGQLLATIDPRPFEMAVQQAVGQRMRDEAQLAAARVTLARFETLLQQDSIARQEVDTQAATVRQFEAAVVTAKANEGTARLNLSYTRIVAPIDGRVGLRTVDLGNTVGPSDANGVAVITKLRPIDVEFAVPQDHAAWLQHNAGAFMEAKAYDRTRTTLLDTGAFASLDNQIDTQTGTVRAKARFNNARQQLFPSQFVNVQLQMRTIRDAVMVPVAALRQGTNGEQVFVLKDDRTVQLRPVVRGQMLGDRVQVATGLQAGEKVITEGADRLRDGARVTLAGDAPGAGRPGGGERRRRAAEGAAPGASAPAGTASKPLAGASAAARAADTTSHWGGGQAPAGAGPRQRGGEAGTPAMGAGPDGDRPRLTPEEREQRRQQRDQRRQQPAGSPAS